MFCPLCKAEYREGFTHCVDCDVDLVNELPPDALVAATSQQAAAPGDPVEDPFCSFWTGDDPRLYLEICELLEKEKIPSKTVHREDHLFHISKYPAYQIGIPFSMFERAEAAIKDAYGSEDEPKDAAGLLQGNEEQGRDSGTIRPWLPAPRGFAWSGKEREQPDGSPDEADDEDRSDEPHRP